MNQAGPIGIFDSGYGGLTVMKEIVRQLPQYDYIYLGDNARAPYGTRSFEAIYAYTLESVQWFFERGCPLVVLACNTASAKALRTIQQNDLQQIAPRNRVLGVIRPTTEKIGTFSRSGSVGILATPGTVQSNSYPIEINKFFPSIKVYQQACPMWVPLIENNEHRSAGAEYFIRSCLESLMRQDEKIDVVLLGCTHYPLISDMIRAHLPEHVAVVGQGAIVAAGLDDYLNRHPEIEGRCTKEAGREFYTTDSVQDFERHATQFFGQAIRAKHV